MYDCQPLPYTRSTIAQAVDITARSLGNNRNSFGLLLCDAAKCVVATGAILKSLYPKLFNAKCEAHLLHNCAVKVKSHFEDVNEPLAKVRLATVQSKTRQAKFAIIRCQSLLVTRRGSWLNADFILCKNLP